MDETSLRKWNEDTVLAHLKEIAAQQLNLPPEQVSGLSMDSRILDALHLDSLAQVVLVTTIEQDFGYTFDAEQWQNLETIGDLVRMIAERASQETVV